MTDYRTLLADAIDTADRAGELDALHDVCVTVLATRVPWLCPDCKGHVGYVTEDLEPCFCPNAPTIGDRLALADRSRDLLLAVTELVIWMSGSPTFGPGGEGHDEWMRARDAVLRPALAALRGEGQ